MAQSNCPLSRPYLGDVGELQRADGARSHRQVLQSTQQKGGESRRQRRPRVSITGSGAAVGLRVQPNSCKWELCFICFGCNCKEMQSSGLLVTGLLIGTIPLCCCFLGKPSGGTRATWSG